MNLHHAFSIAMIAVLTLIIVALLLGLLYSPSRRVQRLWVRLWIWLRWSAIVVTIAMIFSGVVAWAQGVPTQWLNSPNGQEQIGVMAYNPGAQIVDVALGSVRDAAGYSKQTPLTGTTITVGGAVGCSPQAATAGSCVSVLQLTPAGTLSTLTINTPLYPVDGQKMQIFSTQSVSTLTMAASQSQTLNGGLTSLSANAGATWIYSAGSANNNGIWDRIQ